MRALLGAIALASGTALALDAILATLPNVAGGQIVFTSLKGGCRGASHMLYATSPNGKVDYGCWFIIGEHVHALYDDGSRRVYPLTSLEPPRERPKPAAPSRSF